MLTPRIAPNARYAACNVLWYCQCAGVVTRGTLAQAFWHLRRHFTRAQMRAALRYCRLRWLGHVWLA